MPVTEGIASCFAFNGFLPYVCGVDSAFSQ